VLESVPGFGVALAAHQRQTEHQVCGGLRGHPSQGPLRVGLRRLQLVEPRLGFGEGGDGLHVVGLQLQGAHQVRLGLRVLLPVVEGQAQGDERQGPARLQPLGLFQGLDRGHHITHLHQRDAAEVMVLGDRRVHPGQRLERGGGRHGNPRSQGDLGVGAQQLLGVRGQRESALEGRQGARGVLLTGLQAGQGEHRLHRLEAVGRGAQQARGLRPVALALLDARQLEGQLRRQGTQLGGPAQLGDGLGLPGLAEIEQCQVLSRLGKSGPVGQGLFQLALRLFGFALAREHDTQQVSRPRVGAPGQDPAELLLGGDQLTFLDQACHGAQVRRRCGRARLSRGRDGQTEGQSQASDHGVGDRRLSLSWRNASNSRCAASARPSRW
jgi:hypothetical protein